MNNFLMKILFNLFSQREASINIIKLLAKIKSLCTTDASQRKYEREKAFNYYRTNLYGYQVIHTAKSIGKNFWCNGFSHVNENTILGECVNFNGMTITGKGNVNIGNYFHSGIENLIITQTHNYETGDAIPYKGTEHRDVVIGDFVWFGSRVTILPGTKIGDGVVVQAGSVVHGEIPPLAVIGGNPAQIIKYRDKEHYEKLLNEKKYY